MKPPIIVYGNQGLDALRQAITLAHHSGQAVGLIGTFDFGQESLIIKGAVYIFSQEEATIVGGGGGTFTSKPGGNLLPLAAIDVQAPLCSVTIQGLRFLRPSLCAIQVWAANRLEIATCIVAGVVPKTPPGANFMTALGIAVGTRSENDYHRATFGTLSIHDNEIDIGGKTETTDDDLPPSHQSSRESPYPTLGIIINKAGIDNITQRAMVAIAGNTISNVTGFGVDCRDLFGEASISGRNEIAMGQSGYEPVPVSGISCRGTGMYLVRDNNISCGYRKAVGIRLQSTGAPITNATVDSNLINLSSGFHRPTDLALGDPFGPKHVGPPHPHAGISITGNSSTNHVINNTISGQAYAALAVEVNDLNIKSDGNMFAGNHHQVNFNATRADIVVDPGVTGTLITAPSEFQGKGQGLAGTIADKGSGTVYSPDYSLVP